VFERFTQRARAVATHAQEEARQLGHPRIGSEHVLLGLLREPEGAGGRALHGLGLELDGVRADVERRAGPDPAGFADEDVEALHSVGIDLDEVRRSVEDAFGEGALERSRDRWFARGHIPFGADAKKVLELSLREALRLGDRHIGTEHVLLGLVRDDRSPAARILRERGIAAEAVRDAVAREIGRGGDRPGRTA
jgi:ATP-dependent Clp protease ATP-binding subunit ClpA